MDGPTLCGVRDCVGRLGPVGLMPREGNTNSTRHGATKNVVNPKTGKVTYRRSATYNSWRCMKERCYSEGHKWYPSYGGRGIRVCDRWLGKDGFANFLADVGERPAKEITLDRINVNGNYELYGPDGKLQCKWATKKEQRANIREKDCGAAPDPVDSQSLEDA